MPSDKSIPQGHQRPTTPKRHAKNTQITHQRDANYDNAFELSFARDHTPALVAVPFQVMTDPNVDDDAFRIYVGICAYTGMDNLLWITLETLAELLGYTLEEVNGAIARLVEAGYLDKGVYSYE